MSQNNILRDFAKYSSLSVLGMLAMSCYILADTFFVSQSLGTNGLAALNLAIPAYNFVHGVGLMLGMGGATRFSICKSRGEENEANIMFTNTVYLCLGFSVVFFLIGLFFADELILLLGADETIFDMAYTYLQTMILFSPAFIFNDLFLCFIRNDGWPLQQAAWPTSCWTTSLSSRWGWASSAPFWPPDSPRSSASSSCRLTGSKRARASA